MLSSSTHLIVLLQQWVIYKHPQWVVQHLHYAIPPLDHQAGTRRIMEYQMEGWVVCIAATERFAVFVICRVPYNLQQWHIMNSSSYLENKLCIVLAATRQQASFKRQHCAACTHSAALVGGVWC